MENNLVALNVLMQAIGTIGKAGSKLENQIQFVAVQCIAQSIVNRNSTPANELYANSPKGQRHDALLAYFEKFGNLAYLKAEKKIGFFDAEKHGLPKLEWTNAYSNLVRDFHWTKGTKKPDPKSSYDFDEEVGTLIARLTKIASNTTNSIKNKALLDEVVGTYNAYVVRTHEVAHTAPLTDDDKMALLDVATDRLEAMELLESI